MYHTDNCMTVSVMSVSVTCWVLQITVCPTLPLWLSGNSLFHGMDSRGFGPKTITSSLSLCPEGHSWWEKREGEIEIVPPLGHAPLSWRTRSNGAWAAGWLFVFSSFLQWRATPSFSHCNTITCCIAITWVDFNQCCPARGPGGTSGCREHRDIGRFRRGRWESRWRWSARERECRSGEGRGEGARDWTGGRKTPGSTTTTSARRGEEGDRGAGKGNSKYGRHRKEAKLASHCFANQSTEECSMQPLHHLRLWTLARPQKQAGREQGAVGLQSWGRVNVCFRLLRICCCASNCCF